jgi:zinc/manganese transport system permease protein
MAHGAEHIKDLLVGNILWVTWHDVIKVTCIYSAVGIVHYIFRKQLIAVSFDKDAKNHGVWDFLFYALFGIVITSSVSVAGVLQVFAYLIVPSVVGALFFKTVRARLYFGWALGFVLSFVAMVLSAKLDLPSGAFIVVCFTALPIVLLLIGAGRKGD